MIFYEICGRNPNEVAGSSTTALDLVVDGRSLSGVSQGSRKSKAETNAYNEFQSSVASVISRCNLRFFKSLHSAMYNIVRNMHPEWLRWVIISIDYFTYQTWTKRFRKPPNQYKLLFQSLISNFFPPAAGQKVAKKKLQKLFDGQQTSSIVTRNKKSIACGLMYNYKILIM